MHLTPANVRRWARKHQIASHELRCEIHDTLHRCQCCREYFTVESDLDEEGRCDMCADEPTLPGTDAERLWAWGTL